jgi:transcriptional regulator with XRE-family HTH domain
MALQETFIENLKFYRKREKLSQKDLSVLLNKGYNYINSIEGGASFPPPQVIDEIAGILHVEAEILFSKNSCPANINSAFKKEFGESLKDELILRVTEEIEKVCREKFE